MDDNRSEKPRKHLNAAQRRALRAAEDSAFVQRYGYGGKKGHTNDRAINHEVQSRINRLSPEEPDRLMREDED